MDSKSLAVLNGIQRDPSKIAPIRNRAKFCSSFTVLFFISAMATIARITTHIINPVPIKDSMSRGKSNRLPKSLLEEKSSSCLKTEYHNATYGITANRINRAIIRILFKLGSFRGIITYVFSNASSIRSSTPWSDLSQLFTLK